MKYCSHFAKTLAISYKTKKIALAGGAQWIECQPVNRKVAGLVPSQGTYLDGRPGPQLVCERQLIGVSLPRSPSLPPLYK